MKFQAFLIRNLTNMHVGSGDNNFGVVDNLVQRDPVTNNPTINSSSLKGALRVYFETEQFTDYVFGKGGDNSTPGNYKFFPANLIAIPVKSDSKPYYMATCPAVLNAFLTSVEDFGLTNIDISQIKALAEIMTGAEPLVKDSGSIFIEDFKATTNESIPDKIDLLGLENIALFSDKIFSELVGQLPVIARNNLDNGVSTNLWYEETVPRESLLYFVVGIGEKNEAEFVEKLGQGCVQIGGNASIGYGYTKIRRIGE